MSLTFGFDKGLEIVDRNRGIILKIFSTGILIITQKGVNILVIKWSRKIAKRYFSWDKRSVKVAKSEEIVMNLN